MIAGHQQALDELRRIQAADRGAVVIRGQARKSIIGWLDVEIELNFANIKSRPGGIRLRPRELVTVEIPDNFPFSPPQATVRHSRFARLPHVLWQRHICLYLGSNDWNPADGIFGFVERLADWYIRAAHGVLEEVGQPLHPPLTYRVREAGRVVIRADMPEVTAATPWIGTALLAKPESRRADVIAWFDMADLDDSEKSMRWLRAQLATIDRPSDGSVFLGPAIVLGEPLDFEFPRTVGELVAALDARGVEIGDFISLLGLTALINFAGSGDRRRVDPLYTFIGAPMRGIAGSAERQTHLAAWRLSEKEAHLAIQAILPPGNASDAEMITALRQVSEVVAKWISTASVAWAAVYDQRPQIVTRRDSGRPAEWLRDRDILVLGCGALGARIAEHCLRAGATKISFADAGGVSPGILVRQPYEDTDIGFAKADVLANRFRAIRPDATIVPMVGDILRTVLGEDCAIPQADLIIDATANRSVAARIEWLRWTSDKTWPPILTLGVGHDCQRGLAALALSSATGAGTDILQRFATTASAEPRLADVALDFFPEAGSRDLFQPEPGCSEPTFTGSDFDVAALAGHLLAWGVTTLHANAHGRPVASESLHIARLPSLNSSTHTTETLEWENDAVVNDLDAGYQIRIRPGVLNAMRIEALTTAQIYGPLVETGGIVLGQIDDACRVIWITAAESPSSDSKRAQHYFQHGLEGVDEMITDYRMSSHGRTRFVGIWHTHPYSDVGPSETDQEGMKTLLVPTINAPPRAVLLIIGGRSDMWEPWLHGLGAPAIYGHLSQQTITANEVEK